MLQQYHVFVGILVFSLASGKLEILTADPNGDPDADRTFLVGSKLELTCRFPTSKNESSQMFFTSFNANISSVTEKREYTGGYSILTISKPKVTTENEGSYTCKFLSNEKTVAIKIYKDTKEKDQKRFKEYSSNYVTGDSFTLECPILDSLMSTVVWRRDVSPALSTIGDRMSTENVGKLTKNGRITLTNLDTGDRGHYICEAKWYSGNATFKHLVRVKSNLAPLWPAIGIIVEIVILVLIILLCKDRKKGDDDTAPLSSAPASTSGNKEKGNKRKYATSST